MVAKYPQGFTVIVNKRSAALYLRIKISGWKRHNKETC